MAVKSSMYRSTSAHPIIDIINALQQTGIHLTSRDKQNQQHWQTSQWIVGGPMNGKPIADLNVGLQKNTNAVLCLSDADQSAANHQRHSLFHTLPMDDQVDDQAMNQNGSNLQNHLPCIRCGDCVSVCPANLLPQQLFWYAQNEEHQQAMHQGLQDCIECGNCAFVCPSKIPLVQYYRRQKNQIQQEQRQQHQAEIARDRHQQRQQRLEKQRHQHRQQLEHKAPTSSPKIRPTATQHPLQSIH